jgi:hypothetical protein
MRVIAVFGFGCAYVEDRSDRFTGRSSPAVFEFETYPGWGTGMDERGRSTLISLRELGHQRFDHNTNWGA